MDYFFNLSIEALHDILYGLKPRYYEKGIVLKKPDDPITSLSLIEDGCVEVYTNCEGNEFVIERLYRGSIINYRTFFMDNMMYVYIRCAKNTILLDLE